MNKERLRSFVSFILAFLLMVLICTAVISTFVRYRLFNSESYLSILKTNNTEEQIYKSINSDLHYALVVSNLPQDIADGIISEEEVKEEYDSYLNNIIMYLRTGDSVKGVDTEVYLKRFDEKLNKYLADSSVVIDDNLKKDVTELRNSLSQILKNYIEIVDSNMVNKSNILKMSSSYFEWFGGLMYYASFVGIILLAVVIIALWHKAPSRGGIWISRSFMASGSIFTILFLSGLISKFYDNVILYTPYIKEFIAKTIESDVKWFLSCGISIFIAGIIIYVIAKVLSNKNKLLEG